MTAQTVSTTGEKSALNVEPDLSKYSGYQWRTSTTDEYTASTTTAYTYSNTHTYVEFSNGSTVTTCTVTVQNDGNGSATATPATAAAGTEITLTASPNSGYCFKEWQVVSGTVTIADNKFTMPDSNVTVKAIFEADAPTTYTVSFDANGGTGSMDAVTGVSGDYTLPTCTFTAPSGKQFKGWATSENGEVISGTSITVNGDTTLYAIWEDEDAEHSMPGYHVIRTEGFEDKAWPTGWSVEDKDGDGYNWEIILEAYKCHHGSGTATSASYVAGVGELTPDNWLYMPEITIGSGYKLTFCLVAQDEEYPNDKLGVYISTDGGKSYTQIGEDYAAGEEWTEYTVDLSAYAGEKAIMAFVHHNSRDEFELNLDCVYIWAPDDSAETYTVRFDANGGSGSMDAVTDVSGDYTLPANGFTAPSGKQFKGWATSENGEVISGTTITVNGDTTLYAIWEDIPVTTYTVSFNANGGSGEMTAVTDVSGDYTLPTCTFTAPSGKQFKGWATSATGEVISGTTITVNENTTLYAVWEDLSEDTNTVTFDANGGSGSMADVTVVSGDSYTLPSCTFTAPSGKQFKGWATSAGGTVISDATITVTEKITLYAIWEDIPAAAEYSITVTDGKATVGAGTEISKAAEGTTVTLTANAAPAGKEFDKWVVESGSMTLADAESATTTFTMPAGAVSVKATYKDASHTHNLSLVPETPATCTAPGNKAYYTCDGCDKWFEDATGSVEITDKTSVIILATDHTPSDWKSDADNHWKECTVVGCGVVIDGSTAAHTASDWITDTAATATTDGTKHKECTVCHRVLETGTIPATGSTTNPTNANTGATTSPQTGDNSNMILWIVLLLVSGLGVTGTVVYSKRKKYVK